jgi:hypothetical protein
MKQRLGLLIATFAVILGVLSPVPALAGTNVFNDACKKPGTKDSAICKDKGTTTNPLTGSDGLIVKITRIIAVVAGVAAVLIIIISGLRYVLSNGDTAQTTNARNAILYAVVGLIVIVIATSIISLVMSKL